MDVEELVNDLGHVRNLGIPKTVLRDVPALSAALAIRWPDLDERSRRHKLEDLLAGAADQLDDHSAEGIRIALGIGSAARDPVTREFRNKKSRREAFAVHHGLAAETVRRRGGLEDQEFTQLAKAILSSLPTASPTAIAKRPAARPQNDFDDPLGMIRIHAGEAEARGRWGDAAQWGVALLALVRQRADTSPGDHESQLAEEYLQTGLNFLMAGQLGQGREHFINSQRISQTLSEMDPNEPTARGRLALSLTLLGMLDLIAGNGEAAERSLSEALTFFGEPTGGLALNESDVGPLVSALGMLGMYYFLEGQERQAERVLTQAVYLLGPLARKSGAAASNVLKLQLAHALQVLGALHSRQTGREKDAERELTQSVSLLETLVRGSYKGLESHVVPKGARSLLAASLHSLGMLYIESDKTAKSEDALTRSIALLDALMPDGVPNPPDIFSEGMPRLLAANLMMLGGIHAEADRFDEAVNELTRAVAVLDSLLSPGATLSETAKHAPAHLWAASAFERNMLARALMFLGAVEANVERWEDAEQALARSRGIYEQLMQDAPTDSDAIEGLADLLDVLVELYREQGRDELAKDTHAEARSLREQIDGPADPPHEQRS